MLLKSDSNLYQRSIKVSLLNKSSSLAAALGVIELITIAIICLHSTVLLKSDLDVKNCAQMPFRLVYYIKARAQLQL